MTSTKAVRRTIAYAYSHSRGTHHVTEAYSYHETNPSVHTVPLMHSSGEKTTVLIEHNNFTDTAEGA